jgi:hypothetical protein
MKYFTPQLFIRLQDLRDEAAVQEWQRATREYSAALADVLPDLPAPLRKLTKGDALHDADVVSITRLKDTLSVTLRPEVSGDLLILSYELIGAPLINCDAFPPDYQTTHVAWLYDELGVERVPGPPSWLTARDRARGDGLITVATHHILLSNGWEMGLKFRKFKLSRPETYLPSPGTTSGNTLDGLTRSA